MTKHMVAVVLLSAGITFFLRALPFFFFAGERKMPKWLERLGELLPSAIMAILIVYCLKDAKGDFVGKGIPGILGVLVVAFSYKWKHNTFFSIIAGTAVYMMAIRCF